MRCSRCGHELGEKRPSPGEATPCPRCGSGVSAVGVEPFPPQRGRSYASSCGRVAVNFLILCAVLAALFWSLFPWLTATPRHYARRTWCSGNLKQIALAFHDYHDTYKALPAQSIVDENGKSMHSWRIAILPFLETRALYDRYDFSQPWDGPANREVRETGVAIYRCPGSRVGDDSNLTSYFVVYGDETLFAPNEWRTFSDATDGLANTIMLVECDSPDFRVEWSEPRDIPFDRMSFRIDPPEGLGVGSEHQGGINVAFGDGRVRFLASHEIDEATFRYLLMRSDGQPVQIP